jgi:hypothetical protein
MTTSADNRTAGWSWLWRRRRDPGLLASLLARELPPTATGVPVRATFGPFGLIGIAGYIAVPIISFLVLHFLFDFRTDVGLFLGAVSVLLELAAALPHFDNLNRSVTVSAEGVRLEKLHRSYLIPWWQVRAMEASPDLSSVHVYGRDAQITFNTTHVTPATIEALVLAMRAHGQEHDLALGEISVSHRTRDTLIPVACHVGAVGILAFGLYTTFPGTLGMRCSVNSAYLQQRYGTPDRPGCVVLRVSAGAASAGVKVGDLLIEFEGYPITSGQQFGRIFAHSSKPWEVTVLRRGEPEPLHFTVDGGWGKTFQEDPDDPIFYYLRGRWDGAHDPESAILDYTRAIELAPSFDLAYLYRGDLLEDQGRPGMADIRKALELSPGLAEAYSLYSYHLTDNAAAREYIDTAIELSRCEGSFEEMNLDCEQDYVQLSFLQLAAGDPETAAATAVQAIEFYGGYPEPYFYAACAYSRAGDERAAKQYASEYLRFPPSERNGRDTEDALAIVNGDTC